MRQKWRRFWPVLLAFISLAVVILLLAVYQSNQEPPNYTKIEDGLWMGGSVVKPPPGTKAILNLCESDDPFRVESHKWEPIPDTEPAPNLDWLRGQVEYINVQRKARRTVFVHCRSGISRSGMVLVAYLMWRENWSRDQALEYLRLRRPGVRPNPAFMQLLLEWEQFRGLKGEVIVNP